MLQNSVRNIAAFFLIVLSVIISACTAETEEPVHDYFDYRDIPGVTEAEITAIEEIRRNTPFFVYGMTLSTECFRDENGTLSGFAPLMCQWLSDLFGIEFKPGIYDWESLSRELEGEIAFSGEISAFLRNASRYYMTDPIAERRIQTVSLDGWDKVEMLGGNRPRKFGFLAGTATELQVFPNLHLSFEPVLVSNNREAHEKLLSGAIDALFIDETSEGVFSFRGDMIIEDFMPLTYNAVSLVTRNPALASFITVVQKYIENAGNYRFAQMYEQGSLDYRRYNLLSRLNPEERAYAADHKSPENPIPVAIEYDNYPVSFYNTQEREWQGIAVDVLREIGTLTGMYFKFANPPDTGLQDLIAMIYDGRAAMTTELIRTPLGEDRGYLLADIPYLIDHYALISAASFRDISLNEVPRLRVGLIKKTSYTDMFRELFPRHPHTVEYDYRIEAIGALSRGEIDLLMASRNLLLNITNYLEQTGYKTNPVLRQPYESFFAFGQNEEILRSIISKSQKLVDIELPVNNWTRRVFDYSSALARAQRPWFIGASALMLLVLLLLTAMLFRNRKMASRLEITVAQRTAELQERTKELEIQTEAAQAASRAKGEFLARMSHEIRTPLNAIIGMTEIARRTGEMEKKDVSLDEIASASAHLLGLLNDVLDMAKIESGKFTVGREPFAIKAALKEVDDIIRTRCEEKYIDLETGFSGLEGITVLGDKLRLKQVLINLLGNAVKFTADGGVIRFLAEGCGIGESRFRVHLAVSDSGIGMSADQVQRLFTPFEQADASISVRFGGTGLGLAISQNLVKQMGGRITVESEPGRGSVFEFTLDMEKAAAIHAEPPAQSISPDVLRGKRILLAEDIEINRIIIKELLADTGVSIDEAADGGEALRIFADSPAGYYDFIFMDIQMPNMNGHEAARRIRALYRPDAKTVPIIALTANAYKEDADRALEAGMNGHLTKPINIEEVMQTLNRCLKTGCRPDGGPPAGC